MCMFFHNFILIKGLRSYVKHVVSSLCVNFNRIRKDTRIFRQ